MKLVRKFVKSLGFALRGIKVFAHSQLSAQVQLLSFLFMGLLGIYLDLSRLDWLLLVFAAGLVLMAEAFNTAIEINTDLTHPEIHPLARDTKDVAAGAVLIASIAAIVITISVFAPYLLRMTA